jgi:tRNA dimethylallyltransferase
LKTRQYAKRQWTWFRADPEMHWLQGFGDDAAAQAEAAVNEFLAVAPSQRPGESA